MKELDKALEKAKELEQTLARVHKLIDGLKGKENTTTENSDVSEKYSII